MNYEPDSTLSVLVSNPEDIRAGMTVMVPVYRPSSVAKLLGRSVQTLRLWGLKELIPKRRIVRLAGRGCIRKTSSRCWRRIVICWSSRRRSSRTIRFSPLFVRDGLN